MHLCNTVQVFSTDSQGQDPAWNNVILCSRAAVDFSKTLPRTFLCLICDCFSQTVTFIRTNLTASYLIKTGQKERKKKKKTIQHTAARLYNTMSYWWSQIKLLSLHWRLYKQTCSQILCVKARAQRLPALEHWWKSLWHRGPSFLSAGKIHRSAVSIFTLEYLVTWAAQKFMWKYI